MNSPLALKTAFTIGSVPVTTPVVTTWAIMAVLAIGGYAATRRLAPIPTRFQAFLELVVLSVDYQIRDTLRVNPQPYRSFIGTLFFYILAANWSSMIPGVEPPTAHLETDASLAALAFFAAIYFGIRSQGVAGYLKTFAQPTMLMIPLNVAETFTRAFSMSVRLFGNIMSGVFVIGIVLSLAGLFVPIPLMALDLLTGAIQAYIFTVLAAVFIASAINGEENFHDKKGASE